MAGKVNRCLGYHPHPTLPLEGEGHATPILAEAIAGSGHEKGPSDDRPVRGCRRGDSNPHGSTPTTP
jgi:hypothetical protein